MAVKNRSQYEQGYPVTTTYYTPNTAKYSNSTNQGAQPSLAALANRSSNYSASTTKTPVVPSSNYYGSGSTGTSYGSSYGGSSGSSKKSSSSKSSKSSSASSTSNTSSYSNDLLSGESSAPSYDYTSAYNKLLNAYKNQQTGYSDYLNKMNETAQGAYDRGMNTLNNTYNELLSLLSGSYDTQRNTLAENLERAKNSLLSTYNNNKSNLSADAESSLKQAYISNMLAKRNIAQQLSAMGLNGGMTETTLAGMANNYGNQRNNINTALNRSLADLMNNYNNNLSELEGNYSSELANALQAYNNSIASANSQKMQQILALEDALASNQMNAYSNYQNMMDSYNKNYYDLVKQAIANGADISY